MTYVDVNTAVRPETRPARWASSETIVPSGTSNNQLVYLGGDSYVLRGPDLLPMQVGIAVEDNASYVVRSPASGIFGVGRTLAQALRDFRVALHDHYEVLRSERALSEDLREQLAFLEQHLPHP